MSNVNSRFTVQQGREMVRNWENKADEGIMKASTFSVFGLKIPKGPFKNDKEIERLQKLQDKANELMKQILDAMAVVARKTEAKE